MVLHGNAYLGSSLRATGFIGIELSNYYKQIISNWTSVNIWQADGILSINKLLGFLRIWVFQPTTILASILAAALSAPQYGSYAPYGRYTGDYRGHYGGYQGSVVHRILHAFGIPHQDDYNYDYNRYDSRFSLEYVCPTITR
ncbi:unnamed protein product [Notodromas monacha]|uniref:Uncharacterized protein n=1 Tax=Notodromas monacha TaxID=399045 RepID=A0A7R9GHT9_9CRUS|nr:unnamed protein product [Notodromas monacha]CAG0923258.1 unnamed protein product [Notodromas monacha]